MAGIGFFSTSFLPQVVISGLGGRPDFPISVPWLGSAFLEEASYYKLPFPDQSGSLARFPNFPPFFLTEQLKLKQGLCFQSVAARRRIPRGFCLEGWSENARNALRRNGGFAAFAWKGDRKMQEML